MKVLECTLGAINGKNITLRSPEISDAEEMLEYLYKSASETNYLGRYPEEI